MKTKTTLNALYSFSGFQARSQLKGIFGDSPARIVTLVRRQKKRRAHHVVPRPEASMIAGPTGSETWTRAVHGCISNSNIAGCSAGIAKP